MISLIQHAEFFKWQAVSPGKFFAEEKDALMEMQVHNAIVAFIGVEENDAVGSSKKKIVRAVRTLDSLARKLSVEAIVVYPFAHFPITLASPAFSVAAMQEIERGLKEASKGSYRVVRAPFGWHKKREEVVVGHAESVLFKEFR